MIKKVLSGVISGVISNVIGGGGGEQPYTANIIYYPNVGMGTGTTVPPNAPPPAMAPFTFDKLHVFGDSIPAFSFDPARVPNAAAALAGYLDAKHSLPVVITSTATAGDNTADLKARIDADLVQFAGDSEVVCLNQIGMNDFIQNGDWNLLSQPQKDQFVANTQYCSDAISANSNRQIMASITIDGLFVDADPDNKVDELTATYLYNQDYKLVELNRVSPQYFYSAGNPMVNMYDYTRNQYQTWLTDAVHPNDVDRWAYALTLVDQVALLSTATAPAEIAPRNYNDTPPSPSQTVDIVCSLGSSDDGGAANINWFLRPNGSGAGYELKSSLINEDGTAATGVSAYAWSGNVGNGGRGNGGNSTASLDNNQLRTDYWFTPINSAASVYVMVQGLEAGATYEISMCASIGGVASPLNVAVGLGDGIETGGLSDGNKQLDMDSVAITQLTANVLADPYGRLFITSIADNANNLTAISGFRVRSI